MEKLSLFQSIQQENGRYMMTRTLIQQLENVPQPSADVIAKLIENQKLVPYHDIATKIYFWMTAKNNDTVSYLYLESGIWIEGTGEIPLTIDATAATIIYSEPKRLK